MTAPPPADLYGFDAADPVWQVSWLDELRADMPKDAVWPRLMTAPHPAAIGSLGDGFAAFAKARTGMALRWWQRLAAVRLLEVDRAGVLVWDEALLTVARQVGKSWLLRELALWRITHGDRFGEAQDVVHIGKDVAICTEVQRPARLWARADTDRFKVREVNGQEQIEHLADHSRWLVRSKDGVYGLSASLAIVDEAWKVPTVVIDEGLAPTMAERAQSQLLLVTTAHRRSTTLVLNRRQSALADLTGSDVLLLEWSAPESAELGDVDAWKAASPSWTPRRERLVARLLDAAQSGVASDDPDEPDPLEAFSAQWLNRHPPRARHHGRGEPLLGDGVWDACAGTLADAEPAGWVALENWFGHGAAVAFAATNPERRFEVDGIALESWDEALVWARKFLELRPGSRLIVGTSMYSQIPTDMPGYATMRRAGKDETAKALPLIRSLCAERRLVHDPDSAHAAALDAQVDAARVRLSPTGGLTLISTARSDLLRAVLWALADAQKPAPTPAIH